MHRTRSKLAARAHRVATAIERRGVVATYELHDRVLANRHSRRRFARRPPELDDVQRRIVDEVRAEGYAMVPFAELVPDAATRAAVEEQVDGFARQTEEGLAREATGEADPSLRRRAGKEFVVRLWSYEADLGPDDPWFGLSAARGGCSTSPTPTSACGRSSSTWTPGTPSLKRSTPSAAPHSAGIATSTTASC